jgi:hypothetical protein
MSCVFLDHEIMKSFCRRVVPLVVGAIARGIRNDECTSGRSHTFPVANLAFVSQTSVSLNDDSQNINKRVYFSSKTNSIPPDSSNNFLYVKNQCKEHSCGVVVAIWCAILAEQPRDRGWCRSKGVPFAEEILAGSLE